MSMGYEKDGFAFLIDGFELSKCLLPTAESFAPFGVKDVPKGAKL